ncbi:heparan sulfate 2-O-sulfotransferase [Dictyocaulus viviparus]|uniref:Heparan sulfate 2-O-sulfotransferase n=1 Tax=Dictyocaulus viviparus TaxID=29172 RepID=A0A0D8XKM8_DICVI|nr:heparan sulfate 2-O-sulfotransferase [Dictyocaulus viviparus]
MRLLNRTHLLFVNLFVITILLLYVTFCLNNERATNVEDSRVTDAVKSRTNSIILYNRIPKTGSTTFTNAVAYDLYKVNSFNVVHINMTKNRQVMSLKDQREFVNNITNWSVRKPAFYHGHVAFIDFQRFGLQNPIYINIVREPLERLLSHYYFLRFGDNFRVGLKRSRAGNNETFDECMIRGGRDCDMRQMWLQIPYFCGQHYFCTVVGSRDALDHAKRNLINKYLIVGISEQIRDFIALLECLIPHFFNGALKHFDSLSESRAHLRNTKRKFPPSNHTLSLIRKSEAYQLEKEFYEFAKEEFKAVFKKATNGSNNALDVLRLPLQFHYEKIKPERLMSGPI